MLSTLSSTINFSSFLYNIQTLQIELNKFKNKQIYLCLSNQDTYSSIKKIFIETNITFSENKNSNGIILTTLNIPYNICFEEDEKFYIGSTNFAHKKIVKQDKKQTIKYLPKAGEYVVHSTHGIGKCEGIVSIKTGGIEKEFFKIIYRGGDSLYVPYENADCLSLYMSNGIATNLNKLGVEKIDGIMFDLGVSSAQFDEQDRGFSYRYDARLDMRMNQDSSLSAYDVVNSYSLQDLTRIIREYGEENFAYQIAKQIVKVRENSPIETTFQLVDVIKSCLPQKVLKKVGHPAKQTFQAIRIEVNRELEVLEIALKDACEMLNSKGRVAVITFNSLEDRIVKRYFNSLTKEEVTSRYLPSSNKELEYILINKKVIIASEEELERNNRAKPAKLRIIERK